MSEKYKANRIKEMADMFNKMQSTEREKLLGNIEKEDPELHKLICAQMFVFNDLVKIPDQSLQILLSQIHVSDLAIALKTASEALMAKVVSNLSKRVLSALKEEIDSLQKIKVSEVDRAQSAILVLAKQLEKDGKIILNGEYI